MSIHTAEVAEYAAEIAVDLVDGLFQCRNPEYIIAAAKGDHLLACHLVLELLKRVNAAIDTAFPTLEA